MRVLRPIPFARRLFAVSPAVRPLKSGTVVTWLLILGLGLRIWHFFASYTIWYDEAVLLANVMGKSYSQLLGPLDNAVAAPPLYLWFLKTLYLCFGDQPLCWRFPAFACSCGVLLLAAPLARRVLTPAIVPFVVALVAISDQFIWLGCTIKPYTGDTLIAAGLVFYVVSTSGWTSVRRLMILTAAAPILMCLSYPSVFILGGVLLALLPARRDGARSWTAWIGAVIVVTGTFAALYFGTIRNQRVNGLVSEWANYFPDRSKPLLLPLWLADHSAQVFQFCFMPAGYALALLAPFGALRAWRKGPRGLVVLLTVPFVLSMLAASLGFYPYGVCRLMVFIAPCALLLIGLGCEALSGWWSKRPQTTAAILGLFILVNAGLTANHVFKPWKVPNSVATARFIKMNRNPGDRIVSDVGTYRYYFFGELNGFEGLANCRSGDRAWVAMDYYTPELRRWYIEQNMSPAGYTLVQEEVFFDSSAFLFVKR